MNLNQQISRVNNFNLIRIIAALQVVYTHSLVHFEIENNWLEYIGTKFLLYFPGVPIFFTVSGFLIFWSYENMEGKLLKYFRNRFLRLYPALWVCVGLTAILLVIDFPGEKAELLTSTSFYSWIILQLTFFQFYTPDILRFWGVHSPNGSLWTIIVEIQFYIMVPILFYVFKKTKELWHYVYLFIFIVSVFVNYYVGSLDQELTSTKLYTVTIFPYLYFFLMGVLGYKTWDKIRPFIAGKFHIWFLVYLVYIMFFGNFLGIHLKSYLIQNPYNLITSILLCGLTLSAAFSKVDLSERIIKSNDISYGVYIYHMLVINFFVQRLWMKENYYMLLVFIFVIMLAWMSWHFVEKRALQLKKTK